jgi:hypothetical protein
MVNVSISQNNIDMSKLLLRANQQFIDLFGPIEPRPPRTRWQKARAAIGSRFIAVGAWLMGDDAPFIE